LTAIGGGFVQLGIVGGGSSESTPAAKRAGILDGMQRDTRSQPQVDWARKANVICTRTISAYRDLPRMHVTIGVLQKQVDIGWNKVGKIRDLAPPQGEEATYKKYVAAAAAQMEALDERLQLFKSTKVADAAFVRAHNALLVRIHEQNRRSDTLAVELGATICAQEPY
jgi:hypothetical protein